MPTFKDKMDTNSLEFDWFKSREDILKTYAEQRRDRMADAIGDYLTD